MTDVVVVGSLNMDLVVRADRLPEAGETRAAQGFATYPGGKGANQAVAAARLGARVAMVGRMGRDAFGEALLAGIRAEGIDPRGVSADAEAPTGVAVILVEASGDNRILIVAGANGALSPGDVARSAADGIWNGARALLLQLEVPMATVVAAAREGRARGLAVLLDPAPSPPVGLPDELWATVDAVLPNQSEARALTGIDVRSPDDARRAAAALRRRGPRVAVVKLGAEGAFVDTGDAAWYEPGIPVRAVDTTAAGDAFAGGVAARLAAGEGWREAVTFANRAGALAVTRPGAQPAMPRAAEVEAIMKRWHRE